jgi:hypothetical protein
VNEHQLVQLSGSENAKWEVEDVTIPKNNEVG